MFRLGSIRRGLQVLLSSAGLLDLLLLPGIVGHELAHAWTCRVLGVEVEDVTLVQLPRGSFGSGTRYLGRVRHEPTGAAWKSTAIAAAPLPVNTVLALATFGIVKRFVLRIDLARYPNEFTRLFDIYLEYLLASATPGEQLLGIAGLWVGVSLALNAAPSAGDGVQAVEAALRAEGREYRLAYPASVAVFLLGSSSLGLRLVYGVALTAAGLEGQAFAVVIWRDYLVYGALSVLFATLRDRPGILSLLYNRLQNPDHRLTELTPFALRRLDLLYERADAGASLDDDELAYLVAQLDHYYEPVRWQAARALRPVGRDSPERLAPWEEMLLERWSAEASPNARFHLLAALVQGRDAWAGGEALAVVAVDALTADRDSIREMATTLVAHLAADSPEPFAERVATLVAALETTTGDARFNVALALARVADARPAAVEPHEAALEPYRDDPNDDVAEQVAHALDRLAE